MTDYATPNLPARNFGSTAAFYAQLGFDEDYRSESWMIVSRGNATLEFFPYPDLEPYESSFSCCIRLDDLAGMMAQIEASDVPDARQGIPRYHPAGPDPSGLTIAYLIDPDGSLIRLIQND
ncbi:bleomycin resistance protein [Erythrobacter sp. KY5]|uniref:bleomycin resistance protein n=1 Tax=Erythrobacter sp. KY5 TaxID=2011159 RepID=UPI000DBF2CB8|nr:bleomycin resistance protein [Erythrobacter sp. KY5]AWW75049.1 bleomycin resistance protein [Erythrobacter sp. KY5]